ncbi:unnamed protein product, partial [Urochloa humidicola]
LVPCSPEKSAQRGGTEEATKQAGQAATTTAAASRSGGMAAKAISSPVPVEWYPTLAVVMVSVGLMLTASFFIIADAGEFRSRPCYSPEGDEKMRRMLGNRLCYGRDPAMLPPLLLTPGSPRAQHGVTGSLRRRGIGGFFTGL